MKKYGAMAALLLALSVISAPKAEDATAALAMTVSHSINARLLTGSQPTANDLALLAKQGTTVVIDLRNQSEDRGFDEVAVAQQIGLNYVNLPISGPAEITIDNAKKLDALLAQYQNSTVLLHCHSSNRVGALLALRATLQGVDREAALEIGKQNGLRSLEAVVKQQMDLP